MFAFTQTHMFLVHYRELFYVETPFSFVRGISQACFMLFVEEEFVEDGGIFLELGKTISFLFLVGFLFL